MNIRRTMSLQTVFPRMLLCLCATVLLAASVIGALPLAGEETIYENVVRLHVLADSDEAEAQELKLLVRDAVLRYLHETSEQAEDADAACLLYEQRLPGIRETARRTLRENGCDLPVNVTLTDEPYPDRTYGGYTFPAGTYRSLRVMIGRAQGRNWWCVLFPPLCLALAAEPETAETQNGQLSLSPDGDELLLSAGFTPYEVGLLAGGSTENTKIRVKFHIVEWLRAWKTKKSKTE